MTRIGMVVLLLCALFSVNCYAQQASAPSPLKDFQGFWSEFRAAVKADDKEKIASMTAFPFRVKGFDDDDAVKRYEKAQFLKILDRLLDIDSGENLAEEKMRVFIDRKAEVNTKDLRDGGSKASLGNFIFERVKGKWTFTMANGYLEN
jgi:hypothetical protein